MKHSSRNNVQKLGPLVRALAGFIVLVALIGTGGLVLAATTEPFSWSFVVGLVVTGAMLHVSGSVVFTGYAPKYLLFAHGNKNDK